MAKPKAKPKARKLYDSETGCCKRFNPAPWDGKTIVLKDKLFVREKIATLFYIPLNFGSAMKEVAEAIAAAKALPKEPLDLYDCRGLFSADLFVHATKPVPGRKMEKISGTFLTKVFEGDFNKTGEWVKEMEAFVRKKGKKTKKLYFFYTTCPACAKVYGRNYTVLLAQV